MYIRFNETALMVLTTAKEEANDFGVKAVGTEHYDKNLFLLIPLHKSLLHFF